MSFLLASTADTQFARAPATHWSFSPPAPPTVSRKPLARNIQQCNRVTTVDATGTRELHRHVAREGVDPTDIVTGHSHQPEHGRHVAVFQWLQGRRADLYRNQHGRQRPRSRARPSSTPTSAPSRTDRRTRSTSPSRARRTPATATTPARAWPRSHPPARCPPSRMRCSSMATANPVPRRTATVPPRVTMRFSRSI